MRIRECFLLLKSNERELYEVSKKGKDNENKSHRFWIVWCVQSAIYGKCVTHRYE